MDLDDTLLNHKKAQRSASKKFGINHQNQIPHYSSDNFEDLWNDTMMKYFKKFLNGDISFEEHRYFRIRELFDNPEIEKEEALKIFKKYLILYEESWELFEDVYPFLEWCKIQKYNLAIITDGSKKQQNFKLQKMGIDHFFNFVFTAEEEKRSKPDPIFYKCVCKRLNINPLKTFYIGDNIEKDAKGASNAGLIGIWINRENKDLIYNGISIINLNQMKKYLKQ